METLLCQRLGCEHQFERSQRQALAQTPDTITAER